MVISVLYVPTIQKKKKPKNKLTDGLGRHRIIYNKEFNLHIIEK